MPTADLSISVTDGATSVAPGTRDTYTITVTNNGPDTLSGLTLSDAIPAAEVAGPVDAVKLVHFFLVWIKLSMAAMRFRR